MIRDNDRKYGAEFERDGSGIGILYTPIRVTKDNATRERFLGMVQNECLDHNIVLNERHLQSFVSKHFFSGYVAIHEFAVNLKCISIAFIVALVRLHSFYR